MVGRHALSEVEAQFYIANVLLGLQHIHSQDFVYRDLKPEVPHVPTRHLLSIDPWLLQNLVFGANGYLKIIDFGFAKRLLSNGSQTYTLCGTADYIAPEVICGSGHSKSVDLWSCGVSRYWHVCLALFVFMLLELALTCGMDTGVIV